MLLLVCLLGSQLSLSGAVQSGIFGGDEAKPHSRPYMASLQVNGHHTCGGVLIREDYVLTAAHCLNFSDSPFEVVLGAHNVSWRERGQQSLGVAAYTQHPKFPRRRLASNDPRMYHHDVMLLKLDAKAKLTKDVGVLELPKKYGKMKAGVQCEVAGWGQRVLGRGAESVLYEAKVTLANSKDCKNILDAYFSVDQMACSFSKGTGFCQGDSGGPLICQHDGRHVLYGVEAYTGSPCDSPHYPQVYTRVPYFLPWIKEVLQVLHGKDNVTMETGDVWNA